MNTSDLEKEMDSFLEFCPLKERETFKKIIEPLFELKISASDIFEETSFLEKIEKKFQKMLTSIGTKYIKNENLANLARQISHIKKAKQLTEQNALELMELIYNTQKAQKTAKKGKDLIPCHFTEKYYSNGKVIIGDVVETTPSSKKDFSSKNTTDFYVNFFNSFEEALEIHSYALEITTLENKEIEKDPYLYKLTKTKKQEADHAQATRRN